MASNVKKDQMRMVSLLRLLVELSSQVLMKSFYSGAPPFIDRLL